VLDLYLKLIKVIPQGAKESFETPELIDFTFDECFEKFKHVFRNINQELKS